jgi:uncharacterized protein (TIGR02391 family)
MSKLPPLGEIASLMPEELAPHVLRDLASLGPAERSLLNVRGYCGRFDMDIHGATRSQEERIATRHALAEAWALLEHLGMLAPDTEQSYSGNVFVTRRGLEAAKSADAYRQAELRAHFPPTVFHIDLRGAPYDAFVRGNFPQAIRDAFHVLEVRVRKESGLKGHGVPLMRKAFDEDNGPLKSSSADSGERQALPNLFAGAFGWVRNPAMHRDVPVDDVAHAVEQLMLASLLLRIVDDHGWLRTT